MLLTEVLGITPAQRSYIRSYVYRLRDEFNKLKEYHQVIRLVKLKQVVESLSGEDLFQGDERPPLPVELYMDWSTRVRGEFNALGEWKYRIRLNLARMMKVQKGNDGNWYVMEIDYQRIRATLAHELIHFLQRHTKSAHFADPFTSKKDYMNRGFEQGAWAAGDYELIRQELEPYARNGENLAPYIISALRHRGLSDDALKKLKETNPIAWKQLMKKAVQIALKDMDADDKIPWQTDRVLPETK